MPGSQCGQMGSVGSLPQMGGYYPMAQPAQSQRTDDVNNAAASVAAFQMASTAPLNGFKYASEDIVMAAGQYREVRPSVSPALLASGGRRFYTEPAELPSGLQLDPSTGIIWGTPMLSTKKENNGYQYYTVHLTGHGVKAQTVVGIKVVDFQPNNFKITNVSQLDRNKYMVLIDTRKK